MHLHAQNYVRFIKENTIAILKRVSYGKRRVHFAFFGIRNNPPAPFPPFRFPTPLDVTNKDNVAVGRVRRDISRDDNKGLDLFVCGDQVKKGAALNAVQIAELLL